MASSIQNGCMALALTCLLIACGDDQPAHEEHAHEHNHGHVHTAPHGGVLIEVGQHMANLELVCDRSAGTLTVYILGPHADVPVRIASPGIEATVHHGDEQHNITLQAQASELSGETVGDSATFAVSDKLFTGDAELRLHIAVLNMYDQQFENISGTVP